MIINKINIESFRGLDNVEYSLNEKLNAFAGDNKLGKSTIIDSAMWVLCDETLVNGKADSDNRNQHDLKKPLNVSIELDNGIILQRKYRDIWVEDKDGNLKYSRTENKFFVSGAEYKKAEFYDYIKSMIGLNTLIKTKDFNLLRGIMDYNYFNSIDYKVARKFIEELLGLKSDTELLNDENFKDIKVAMLGQMKGGIVDTVKCRNKYKNEINTLEIQIKDKEAVIKNLNENTDKEKFKSVSSEELEKQRNELMAKDVRNENKYKELTDNIENKNQEIIKAQRDTITNENKFSNLENELITKGNACNAKIENDVANIKNLNGKIQQLEAEKNRIMGLQFQEIKCPHCGKAVNSNEYDSWVKKNKDTINEIDSQIQKGKDLIKQLNDSIETTKATVMDLRKQYIENNKNLKEVKAEIENNTKVKELELEKDNLNKELNGFISDFNTDKNSQLMELNEKIREIDSIAKNLATIINEQETLKKLKISKAVAENNFDLVKEFENMKKKMIRDNTDKVFPDVEMQIIEENENTGVLTDVCHANLKGVEYKAVNDGHRYLIGITIIEDIKKALGLQDLPIIFDKFGDIGEELLTEIESKTNAQILTTLVTNDKEITLKENR